LRTILENGVVVETVTRPTRGALPAEKTPGFSMDRLIGKMVLGPMPLWGRENRPRWGYYVELVDTDRPSVLWQRHRQRSEELAQALQTSTRPHDSLPLHVALSQRSHQLTDYVGTWRVRITNGTVAAFMLFVLVIASQSEGLMVALYERLGFVGGLSALLLGMIVLAMLAIPLSLALRAQIIPLLPGPPLKPVDELLRGQD
jgi:hypothetical protein